MASATTDGNNPAAAGSVIEASDGSRETNYIHIQDITSTANLGIPLDLKRIARACHNTEFNPRRFGAAVMRLREPQATALIFPSGKLCIKGCKTIQEASLAAQRLATIIQRVGYSPKEFLDFNVQNIVGAAQVGFSIRLEALAYAHSMFASYEPELFPGLVYRLVHPRVVFMVFVSGKIVMTGGKTEADLAQAFTKLYPILMEFRDRKVHVATPSTGESGDTQQET